MENGDKEEILLIGGQQTHGIVRIGNTVRRPLKENAAFVHQLLTFLETQGFQPAPRFLGMDEQGREILTYIEGKTLPGTGYKLSDEQLIAITKLILHLHDLTAGCSLKGQAEIVAHHDIGPHNIIFKGRIPIGLIDWDEAAPGTRLRDFANAIWCCVDLSNRQWDTHEQARRMQLMCQAYGWNNPIVLVNDMEQDLSCALQNHQKAGRYKAVVIFQEEMDWFRVRAQDLREILSDQTF
jgi:hypothetical protein